MKSFQINCETGEETFVDLSADEIATIEANIEQALKDQATEQTIDQKLASVGLSIDDLKSALGL